MLREAPMDFERLCKDLYRRVHEVSRSSVHTDIHTHMHMSVFFHTDMKGCFIKPMWIRVLQPIPSFFPTNSLKFADLHRNLFFANCKGTELLVGCKINAYAPCNLTRDLPVVAEQ